VINNSGKIESSGLISGPSNVGAAVNHEGGLIKNVGAILDPALNFKNEGKVQGLVLTSGYDDKIINKKVIKGDVLLASGDDTFKNKGNAKAGLIDTQDGNDLVAFGNKADKLLFDSTLSAATNVDTVKKFAPGKDAIYLDDDIFTTITPGTPVGRCLPQGHVGGRRDDRIISYDKARAPSTADPGRHRRACPDASVRWLRTAARTSRPRTSPSAITASRSEPRPGAASSHRGGPFHRRPVSTAAAAGNV
jgi:hypothetical protein